MKHTHRYLPEHDHETPNGGVELAPGFFDHVHTTAGRVTWVDAPDTASDLSLDGNIFEYEGEDEDI